MVQEAGTKIHESLNLKSNYNFSFYKNPRYISHSSFSGSVPVHQSDPNKSHNNLKQNKINHKPNFFSCCCFSSLIIQSKRCWYRCSTKLWQRHWARGWSRCSRTACQCTEISKHFVGDDLIGSIWCVVSVPEDVIPAIGTELGVGQAHATNGRVNITARRGRDLKPFKLNNFKINVHKLNLFFNLFRIF